MNNKRTVELSIKELLIVLLRNWIPLLIIVAISASAFGIKTYYERRDSFKQSYRNYQVSLSTYNQEIFATEEAIRYNTLKGNAQDAAAKNSVFMQVDPFNVRMAHITFVVNAEGTGNLDSVNRNIVNIYRALILSAPTSEIYKGIDFGKYTDDRLVGLIYIVEPEKGTVAPVNLINVSAIGNEDIDPMQSLQNLAAYLHKQREDIAPTTAAHQLTTVGERSTYETNDILALQQNEKRASVKEATKTIKDLEDDLVRIAGRKPKAPSLLRQVVKQSVIAGFITAVLVALVIISIYLVQIRIQTADQIRTQLGIRYLGGGAYKCRKFIGRWGDLLGGTSKSSSDSAVNNLIKENLKSILSNKSCTILLTGTVSQETLEDFSVRLRDLCPEFVTEFFVQTDLVNNALAIQALEKAEGVIFVERINSSKLKQVSRNYERVLQSNKKVLGYALV